MSNIGSLVKPLTAARFRSGDERCYGLFSHYDQYTAAQTLHCQVTGSGPKGSGGRMADALLRGNMSFKTESFSVPQANLWPQGFHVPSTAVDQRPWESMMVPIAEWMGVEQHQMEEAFPILNISD